jgi:predicted ATPase
LVFNDLVVCLFLSDEALLTLPLKLNIVNNLYFYLNSKTMIERIIVENFGPIKHVDLEIKQVNIFIGKTSSGKSTVAKLLAIFKNSSFQSQIKSQRKGSDDAGYFIKEFKKLLNFYNIDYKLSPETLIRYEQGHLFWEFQSNGFQSNFGTYSFVPEINLVYIPAERSFFSALSQSIFSLITNDIALPKALTEFGSKFEIARRDSKSLSVKFLDITYKYVDGEDIIEMNNGESIKLSQASSGIQSTIPLMQVLGAYTEDTSNVNKESGYDLFVIEEPEINLYPSAQKELLEYIIQRIARSKDRLIITTHSPYILTALDNLVQADNVAKEQKENAALSNIIKKELWTDFSEVTCNFFEDGSAWSTLDYELRSLGPSKIDNVSEELGNTFEQLLNLRYEGK